MEETAFPDDPMRIQQVWSETNQALCAHRPQEAALLRRRLPRRSVHQWWQPFWSGTVASPAARVEPCRAVRSWEAVAA
ncbi:hypothetical protein [Streptomyces sp. NPDC008150]|uniref:hypothetical protein n=1 Tax=Streptomyces sp. NPDC008150 TaxID=3364816 RepID=UPI0036EEE456